MGSSYPLFDRSELALKPLAERRHDLTIESMQLQRDTATGQDRLWLSVRNASNRERNLRLALGDDAASGEVAAAAVAVVGARWLLAATVDTTYQQAEVVRNMHLPRGPLPASLRAELLEVPERVTNAEGIRSLLEVPERLAKARGAWCVAIWDEFQEIAAMGSPRTYRVNRERASRFMPSRPRASRRAM